MMLSVSGIIRIWQPVPEKSQSNGLSSIPSGSPQPLRHKKWGRKRRNKRYIRPFGRSNTNAPWIPTNKMSIFNRKKTGSPVFRDNFWARAGMNVTFRAEIMPGKLRSERTFRIEKVLPNGRVVLQDFLGEHREGAFEPLNFLRDKVLRDQNS